MRYFMYDIYDMFTLMYWFIEFLHFLVSNRFINSSELEMIIKVTRYCLYSNVVYNF